MSQYVIFMHFYQAEPVPGVDHSNLMDLRTFSFLAASDEQALEIAKEVVYDNIDGRTLYEVARIFYSGEMHPRDPHPTTGEV